MLIYILRHGDAFSDINLSDSERPLTDTGTQQSSIAGTFLRMTKANVDLIVSSPLLRAKQTASVIQEQIGSKKPITSDLLLNGTDQLELFQYINKLGVSSLLLVGHIPHLEDTITSIINGNSENEIKLKKCSLAIIQAQRPIDPGSGQLKQLLHIDAIANLIKS